ncbi:MAG: hypothetical protein K9G58_08575 [Bacteroidales bacterium]|nr:hypothetical protein [Bacteroidales bacterium]MCF8386330.1 hypothetical protein [Bacteroidales bacterium]MCF8398207.1 hypothetical protein [Bacteroidales bacterium]
MEFSILTLLVGILISILVGGFFMWMGAKMAAVKNATFGRAVIAALWVALIMWIIPYIFALLAIGTWFGWLVGLILALFAIQGVFATSFLRALLVWVFSIVAQVIVGFLLTLIFGIEFSLLYNYSF